MMLRALACMQACVARTRTVQQRLLAALEQQP